MPSATSYKATLMTFCLFLGLTTASAQITFTTHLYSTSDYSASSAVSGDFNNDGILDMVSANAQSYSFYKGLGGGQFALPITYDLDSLVYQVLAADLNGDGNLDLAVSCGGCYPSVGIIILLGNGDGTFTAGQSIPEDYATSYIAMADFNGDHIPDIAISGCDISYNCSLEIFLGTGNGTFTQSATLSDGGANIVAADFNADGHQDLAVFTDPPGGQQSEIQLAVYLGNGNGTFQNPLLVSQPYAVSMAVGDFYNDRIQSLAILSQVNGPNVDTVRYSNGTLEASAPQVINAPGSFFSIGAGDINGDLLDDIVVTGFEVVVNTVYPYSNYLLGTGTGTFQSPVSTPAVGETANFPFVRDLNLDSRHDIGSAWAYSYEEQSGGAYVLINKNATVNCGPPKANALSVNICAPKSGQTVGKTFTFKGAGNAFNGIAKRMELWIDGKKVGQNLEDQLKITTTLSSGSHTASFVVVDSFDNSASKKVTFNVD